MSANVLVLGGGVGGNVTATELRRPVCLDIAARTPGGAGAGPRD